MGARIAAALALLSALPLGATATAQKTEDYHDEASPLFHEGDGTAAAAAGDSFPSFVTFGDAPAPDWTKAPAAAKAPALQSKQFSVKGCAFTVKTGPFTINQYSIAGVSDYAIEAARVPEHTIFKSIVGGSLYLSVSADLEVSVDPKSLAACKKAFDNGRRGRIPTLEFTQQPVGLAGPAGKRVAATDVIKPATSDPLYIGWSVDHQTLALTNKEGGDAIIESAACEYKPAAAVGFYLSFTPSWKVMRAKDLAAKDNKTAH